MRVCVCIGLAGSNRNITTVMPSIRILLFLLEEKLGGTQHLCEFFELFLSKLKIYYDRGALHQHLWNLKYLYLHCISFIKFIFRRVYVLKEQRGKRIIRDP